MSKGESLAPQLTSTLFAVLPVATLSRLIHYNYEAVEKHSFSFPSFFSCKLLDLHEFL
jgi:hypothetical protein